MVRDGHAVMGDLVQVDRADPVDRADQGLLDIPGQVAAIEEVERLEPDPKRQTAGVVAGVGLLVVGCLDTQRVGRSGRRDHLASRGEHNHLDAVQRQSVAGAEGLAPPVAHLPVGEAQRVGRPGSVGKRHLVAFGRPGVGQAAVPEVVDPQTLRKPFNAAVMVGVPVGRRQVVEVVESGHLTHDMFDPLRVAVVLARPAGIDQERSSLRARSRADHKGRRSTHDVNEVDIEPRVRSRPVGPHQAQRQDGRGQPPGTPCRHCYASIYQGVDSGAFRPGTLRRSLPNTNTKPLPRRHPVSAQGGWEAFSQHACCRGSRQIRHSCREVKSNPISRQDAAGEESRRRRVWNTDEARFPEREKR